MNDSVHRKASFARRISGRLRKGLPIPFTGRRVSLSFVPRDGVGTASPSSPDAARALDAVACKIALHHIDHLMELCPDLRRYHLAGAQTDLETALAFLEFCNNSVALFAPQSRNVHLRRQLCTLKDKATDPVWRDHVERQIAILDLEDGVVERAAVIAQDAQYRQAYDREISDYDSHYEAVPPFLAKGRHELDYSRELRGGSMLWFITRNPDLFRGKRILHFGPESIVKAFFDDPANGMNCRYETADGFSSSVDHLTDITALGLADGAYDIVICHRVLEHVLDDRGGLREIHRVLKPGGFLDISVPQSMNRGQTVEWLAQDSSHHDHVRQYGRDFTERLEAAGFAVAVEKSLLTRPSPEHYHDGTYPMRHYLCTKTLTSGDISV